MVNSMEIKATGTMNLETLCVMSRLLMFRKANPKTRMLLWSAFYVAIMGFIVWQIILNGPEDSLVLSVIILLAAAGVGCHMYFILPRKQYKKLGKMQNALNTYTFTEDTLVIDTVDAKGNVFQSNNENSYTNITKVMETDRYMFIWPAKDRVFIMDKTTIQNGTDEDIRKRVTSGENVQYIRCRY